MIIKGIVENGKRLGRTIGFPTANIAPEGDVRLPENGVYVAAIWIEGEERPRVCMLNQGNHPTAPEGKATIEAHILDFAGNIYGKRVQVEYLHFLRPEKRFDSLSDLRAQLEYDCMETRSWGLQNADKYSWHK